VRLAYFYPYIVFRYYTKEQKEAGVNMRGKRLELLLDSKYHNSGVATESDRERTSSWKQGIGKRNACR
jgi:hypothetical protein